MQSSPPGFQRMSKLEQDFFGSGSGSALDGNASLMDVMATSKSQSKPPRSMFKMLSNSLAIPLTSNLSSGISALAKPINNLPSFPKRSERKDDPSAEETPAVEVDDDNNAQATLSNGEAKRSSSSSKDTSPMRDNTKVRQRRRQSKVPKPDSAAEPPGSLRRHRSEGAMSHRSRRATITEEAKGAVNAAFMPNKSKRGSSRPSEADLLRSFSKSRQNRLKTDLLKGSNHNSRKVDPLNGGNHSSKKTDPLSRGPRRGRSKTPSTLKEGTQKEDSPKDAVTIKDSDVKLPVSRISRSERISTRASKDDDDVHFKEHLNLLNASGWDLNAKDICVAPFVRSKSDVLPMRIKHVSSLPALGPGDSNTCGDASNIDGRANSFRRRNSTPNSILKALGPLAPVSSDRQQATKHDVLEKHERPTLRSARMGLDAPSGSLECSVAPSVGTASRRQGRHSSKSPKPDKLKPTSVKVNKRLASDESYDLAPPIPPSLMSRSLNLLQHYQRMKSRSRRKML